MRSGGAERRARIFRAVARWLTAAAIAAAMFAVVELVLVGEVAPAMVAYGVGVLMALGAAPFVAAGAALVAWRPRLRIRRAGLVVAGLVAFAGGTAADLMVPGTLYPGLHDLTFVLAATGALVAASVVRASWRWSVGAVALAVACCLVVGDGWRSRAVYRGRHAARLVRWTQAVADLDRDGYAGIAWGGDCDDLDEDVHPLARDAPGGGDANCNGVDPPRAPVDADFGLGPLVGSPDAPESYDLVVLITIDALRADAAAEPSMFSRMYAAGTRTRTALPLALRIPGGPSVAARLKAAGIATTFASGVKDPTLAELYDGFDRVILPEGHELPASELTTAAIEAIPASGRRFLWIHYFDPHEPYDGRAGYLRDVEQVDLALARLNVALAPTRALVIVTADHGEAFGEHGVEFHGVSAYDELVRVPVWTDPPFPGDPLASHLDLPPTILGAFGLVGQTAGAERLGRSWWRLLGHPDAVLHDFVVTRSARYASGDEEQTPMMAIITKDAKLAVTFADDTRELYAAPGDAPLRDARLAAELYRKLSVYRDLVGWP